MLLYCIYYCIGRAKYLTECFKFGSYILLRRRCTGWARVGLLIKKVRTKIMKPHDYIGRPS